MWQSVFKAGLLAGTLDISAACINAYTKTGTTPDRVIRFVASGVFGSSAFSGGNSMIFFGLLFHFIIAFSVAAAYFFIYPRLKDRLTNRWFNSVLIGVTTWCVTELIIVPASNAPSFPFTLTRVVVGMSILIVCIGVPIAFIAQRHFSRN